MSFDEVRLPVNVEKGALGGPTFNTTVIELSSGFEQRNQNWSVAKAKYDIAYSIQTIEDLYLVIAFFYARKGKARGFRFRDWSDYQITSNEQFGTGDGVETQFQLSVTYSDAASSYTRNIKKPVSGSVRIWVNSVEVFSPASWSVDTTTGIVTFVTAPTSGHAIEWQGEFDVPVRFDNDSLGVNMEIFNAGTIGSIPLVEIRQ